MAPPFPSSLDELEPWQVYADQLLERSERLGSYLAYELSLGDEPTVAEVKVLQLPLASQHPAHVLGPHGGFGGPPQADETRNTKSTRKAFFIGAFYAGRALTVTRPTLQPGQGEEIRAALRSVGMRSRPAPNTLWSSR